MLFGFIDRSRPSPLRNCASSDGRSGNRQRHHEPQTPLQGRFQFTLLVLYRLSLVLHRDAGPVMDPILKSSEPPSKPCSIVRAVRVGIWGFTSISGRLLQGVALLGWTVGLDDRSKQHPIHRRLRRLLPRPYSQSAKTSHKPRVYLSKGL